jgi:hypothetical protein
MAGLGLGVGSASTSDGTTMVAKGAAITPAAKRLFTREPKRERRVSIFLSSQLKGRKTDCDNDGHPYRPEHAVFSSVTVTERSLEYSRAPPAGK